MRILYLASKYKPESYNGTIKFIENITNHFNKKEEILLVSYCEVAKEKSMQYRNINYWEEIIDDVRCIKFTTREKIKSNYSLFDKEIYEFSLKIINDFRPDLIHICHVRRVYSFMKAAIDLKKKYILTLTDSLLVCPNTFLLTKEFDLCKKRHQNNICQVECGFKNEIIKDNCDLRKLYLNNAYMLVAPSRFQADIYEEYINKEVLVINHGNDICNKYVEKKYPKDKLIFGFSGSGLALKGLNILLTAFRKLENIVNVELHIYGQVDDTAKGFMSSNIIYKGCYNNKDVSTVLNSIDILICPSIWYENYPFAITEAFINSVPVIATDEGGMKELVKNFVNGFTFELGNIEQLMQIIINLYNNQYIITNLINNLKTYSPQSIDKEMKEYEKIYLSCINEYNIEIHKQNIVEKIWIDLIESKYNINNKINYYKQCIILCSSKHNYVPSIDMIYRFIARICNLNDRLKNQNIKKIVIWGAGTSGKITVDILLSIYNDINIEYIIDKFTVEESFRDIPIKRPQLLKGDFEYLFICTNPGKKEVLLLMEELQKDINRDYAYGMCIE